MYVLYIKYTYIYIYIKRENNGTVVGWIMLKIPISESCHGPFSDLALPDSFWLHGRGSGCWLPGCGFNELLGWTSSCHHLWTFQDVPSHCEPSCSKNSGDCSLSNDSRSTWPHLNSAGQKAKYNAQTFSARCKSCSSTYLAASSSGTATGFLDVNGQIYSELQRPLPVKLKLLGGR